MSYDLLGYNLLNSGGISPYGMGMNMMTNSLYMMNFCNQLKNYYIGSANTAKGTEGTAAGTATAGASTDFQTAFQEAFRKAFQETLGITDSNAAAAQTSSDTAHTSAKAAADRTVTAQDAYQTMSSYCRHPSRIWSSSFAHR